MSCIIVRYLQVFFNDHENPANLLKTNPNLKRCELINKCSLLKASLFSLKEENSTISPLGGRCCNWALLSQTHMESWGDEKREEKEGEAGIGGLEGGETYL